MLSVVVVVVGTGGALLSAALILSKVTFLGAEGAIRSADVSSLRVHVHACA
jgi:hypothetical protein